MSAAAARRRKQLLARKASEGEDLVTQQLNKLLSPSGEPMDEASAYETLQLAQSQVKKKEHSGDYVGATDLAYQASLALLKKGRVSVASQLLNLMVEILRETHTAETDTHLDRIVELHEAHIKAMDGQTGQEATRLHRLQRDWLRAMTTWSAELGRTKFGSNRLHALLSEQSWILASLVVVEEEDDEEDIIDLRCDAVQHSALAENPEKILEMLKTLPAPTEDETKLGHTCPPAQRDALLTRALLAFCALENLRDGNKLLRAYIDTIEERPIADLAKSYTNKDDGKAPSHVIFGCMLLRICEKDVRTGPLFSWLLRSFKRELDRLYKPQVVLGYTTKIGKIYFNITPPPSMMNMMENMMSMMGGGGGGGGINPAMMQAAMAQMQQGGMM
jgi:Golgi to ER traffic protein 4